MSKDSPLSNTTSGRWSPSEVIAQPPDWLERLLGWWFRMTTPPGLGTASMYIDRVQYQKARLTSTIVFIYLLFVVLCTYPVMYSSPTVYLSGLTIIGYLLAYPICFLLLVLNRFGKTVLAGALLTLIFETGMAASFLILPVLDTSNLPLYNLFVVGELLAASMLPANSVFVVALLNSLFIASDLLLQQHSQSLNVFLHQQFAMAVLVPVGLQFVVAGVILFWVSSSAQADKRANRAEMVAMLEHTVAEQLEEENKTKLELEESIQQLVEEHTQAANNRFATRISYPPAKVLWPLVGVVNSLAARLQHAEKSNRELDQLRQAVTEATMTFRQVALSPDKPLQLQRTGTEVDLLVLATKRLHEATAQANRLSTNG